MLIHFRKLHCENVLFQAFVLCSHYLGAGTGLDGRVWSMLTCLWRSEQAMEVTIIMSSVNWGFWIIIIGAGAIICPLDTWAPSMAQDC